jgi:hypothetical protein
MEGKDLGGNPCEANADFFTDFEYEEEDYLEGITHGGQPNRNLATEGKIGPKSFGAHLRTVQWGKFDGEDAMLLVFDFHFGYNATGQDRITEAHIEIAFEETADQWLHPPQKRNITNDPIVKKVWPGAWRAHLRKTEQALEWTISPELSVLDFFTLRAGQVSSSYTIEREYSLRLVAGMGSTDAKHHDYNLSSWHVYEDGLKKAGIPRNFSGAVLATLPKDPPYPIAAQVTVKTEVASFITNLIRPLRSKNDDPIFLDRSTPEPKTRPCSYGSAGQDFADPAFPWNELNVLPRVDEVCSTYKEFAISLVVLTFVIFSRSLILLDPNIITASLEFSQAGRSAPGSSRTSTSYYAYGPL